MAFLDVGRASSLPPNSVMEVEVGDRLFAICNVGGTLYALDGICPHTGGPLGQGQIDEGRLVCPYHMWEFDCRTGEFDYDPSKRVATFEVRVEGDDILLEVPERA